MGSFSSGRASEYCLSRTFCCAFVAQQYCVALVDDEGAVALQCCAMDAAAARSPITVLRACGLRVRIQGGAVVIFMKSLARTRARNGILSSITSM